MADLPQRIKREIEKLSENLEKLPGIKIAPTAENRRYFTGTISGPPGTCFEGGLFHFELFLPAGYPMDPPKVRLLTKIFHPNFDKIGRICLDIIKPQRWTPALQIVQVCLSIQQLMGSPEPSDPLANDVAEVWKTNEALALKTAREWTAKFAK